MDSCLLIFFPVSLLRMSAISSLTLSAPVCSESRPILIALIFSQLAELFLSFDSPHVSIPVHLENPRLCPSSHISLLVDPCLCFSLMISHLFAAWSLASDF